MPDAQTTFLAALSDSVKNREFVRLNLHEYRGTESDLRKIIVRPVVIKQTEKLSFTYSYRTRDIVKNYDPADALTRLAATMRDFRKTSLTTASFILAYPSMQRQDVASEPVDLSHDRRKTRHVETAGRSYLTALGITDAHGAVLKSAQDKYRQIDKYIEILAGLLKDRSDIARIVDMGCGKGYLTFALYDYLTATLKNDVEITGVELRRELVETCNAIAAKAGFEKLGFRQGSIDGFDAAGTDLLIALHACDTATDDAIYKGILAGSKLIVTAPCCHKQVRREMEQGRHDPALTPLLRHGIFMERQAEMVTDALRALLLEKNGYSVKAFEFVSDAHTPKNVMIVAARSQAKPDEDKIQNRIDVLKEEFGVGTHYLETLLGQSRQ